MKKSGVIAASVAAASAVAASSSSSSKTQIPHQDGCERKSSKNSASDGDKFAPRFDGLRFIETLVTAHR